MYLYQRKKIVNIIKIELVIIVSETVTNRIKSKNYLQLPTAYPSVSLHLFLLIGNITDG